MKKKASMARKKVSCGFSQKSKLYVLWKENVEKQNE
jgi:hypothetical protein